MNLIMIAIAGSFGAVARYWVSGLVQSRTRADFPAGTMLVNVSGSLAIGLIAGGSPFGPETTAALIGFLAGYTTFSTWMIETLGLGLMQLRSRAVLNLALTLVLGITLTLIGYSLAA